MTINGFKYVHINVRGGMQGSSRSVAVEIKPAKEIAKEPKSAVASIPEEDVSNTPVVAIAKILEEEDVKTLTGRVRNIECELLESTNNLAQIE